MNTVTVSLLHRLSSPFTIFLRTVSESELTYGGGSAKIGATMSAQDDLIIAARSLRDQGLSAYSLADLLSTARRYGSTYPDPVLRKTIESMVESPDDAAQNRDVNLDIGERVHVTRWAADRTARVQYRGSGWTARLAPDAQPQAGEHVVTAVEGNWLVLTPLPAR